MLRKRLEDLLLVVAEKHVLGHLVLFPFFVFFLFELDVVQLILLHG
jgi:hypothetical protein